MSAVRLARGCSRLFLLELEARAEPLCFLLRAEPSAPSCLSSTLALLSAFGSARLFSLLVHGGGRVHRARSHAELVNALSSRLPPECRVLPLTAFLPGVKDSVTRGFFLRDESTSSSSTERVLNELKQSHALTVFSYEPEENGGGQYWCQELWGCPTTDTEAGENQRLYVTPVTAPQENPTALHIINSVVFYRLDDAYQVLEECRDIIPESKEVLEIVNQQLEAYRRDIGFPVVVIEGLDATGKTTLTESLQQALGATLLKSPPQCLAAFRQRFDSEPPLIRRAFYALGNYITAAQIARESLQRPVIVDRYWHSTAAYAIATAVSGAVEKLPALGSEIYEWPSDLLRPSLVLLLTVSPRERLRRLQGRGLGQTEEETQLEVNDLFRQKVDEAYKRIQNPACVTVDASPSPDQVLQQVLSLIRNKCHL